MKKTILVLIILFLIISILGCTDAKSEIVKNISYDVKKSSVVFPYNDYDLNIGITPLFIHELTPLNNSEGLYGYVNQQGQIVIDYQFTKALNFNDLGYAEIYNGEGCNVIDKQGSKIFEQDLIGWNYIGYTDSYLKFSNRSADDNLNEILIYDYDAVLIKSYTSQNEYLQYTEYPTTFASEYISSSNFNVSSPILYDSSNNLLDTDIFNSIRYTYRNMINAAVNENFTPERRYGTFTNSGNIVVPAEYIFQVEFGSLWQFSDLAEIMTDEGLYGFVDYTGEIVIEPKYQSTMNPETGHYNKRNYDYLFNEGVQKVVDNGRGLVIDYLGNILFEGNEFQTILDCNSELIAVRNHFEIDELEYYVVDVFDYEGNIVYRNESDVDIVFTQDDSDVFFVTSYKTGYDNVSDEMYNHSGKLLKSNIDVIQLLYNDIYTSFVNGALVVKDLTTKKFGFIDEFGNWMIEPGFDDGRGIFWDTNNYIFYSDGYAVVYKDDKYGIIDKQGNYIIDCVLSKSPYDIMYFCLEMLVPKD